MASRLEEQREAMKRRNEFMEKHKGHEEMHAEMTIIFFMIMIIVQIVLVLWKNKHPKSYHSVTLVGLWLIPFIFVVNLGWWRMTSAWTLFSIATLYIIFRATRNPMTATTPRLVYRWFLFVYKLCYALVLIGYLFIMTLLIGGGHLAHVAPDSLMELGTTVIFYGLYFGVLGRDIAEVCTELIAVKIGYVSASGLPVKSALIDVCAICGQEMNTTEGEKCYKLNCRHLFHEFCIRGWCMVGKKQTCPYCKEKVDLKLMFSNPWERTHVQYASLLDFLRYIIVWLPVIFTASRLANYLIGLD
ncbi:E3 ubiquitin ligase RNF121-like [Oscarella lobularis]|uniref:E3 ubiquitin ligase RNF121-like n=1 Tax=Oscarella lobularis TaxID=121494 RepID=UPI00331386EF